MKKLFINHDSIAMISNGIPQSWYGMEGPDPTRDGRLHWSYLRPVKKHDGGYYTEGRHMLGNYIDQDFDGIVLIHAPAK